MAPEEVRRIAETDDLHTAPFLEDSMTYGTFTWIGMTDAGMTREVTFDSVEGPINDRIDDAYRAKYRGSRYFNPMISARARAAMIRISPRVVQ